MDRGYDGVTPTKLGKEPKRWKVAPKKQNTYKNKSYRTDRLRRFLGIEPHKDHNRKTRKVHNKTSETRRMLNPEMKHKFWKRA